MRDIFFELANAYSSDQELVSEYWNEIESYYAQSHRHYHNLNHIQDLYEQLKAVKTEIKNWNIILFSLFYHDIIYKSTKSNNEEKSAEIAVKRMEALKVSSQEIEQCAAQILATKSHVHNNDSDTNYFTDADLSILGRDWETYDTYCKNIRKEYSMYPMFAYRKGRKKVIKHFLDMDTLFKTTYFNSKFEQQARANLKQELELL